MWVMPLRTTNRSLPLRSHATRLRDVTFASLMHMREVLLLIQRIVGVAVGVQTEQRGAMSSDNRGGEAAGTIARPRRRHRQCFWLPRLS